MNLQRKKDSPSTWSSAYQLAFGTDPDKLQKMEIYKEAVKGGADVKQALLFGRLEALIRATVGSFASESQNSLVAVSLQLQTELNNRTSYLGYQVGRLWQGQGTGNVATAAWNFAAGSAIGQRLGLTPIPTAPTAPTSPIIPKAADPHADTSNPPVVALSSTLDALGFTFSVDTTVSQCDRTGVITLKNESGGTVAMSAGVDLISVEYHTEYSQRPIVTAYVENDASESHAGIIGTLAVKDGGHVDGFTLQSLQASSDDLPNNGTIKVRWFVQDALPSS